MMIISNKKVVLYAVLFFCIFQLKAQISINKSDMPSVNDIVCTSTGLNPDFIDFQETGEDYIWDFSQLVSISQQVDTFVSQLNVPLYYIPFFMFNSNLAKNGDIGIPIPEFPITNPTTFYNSTDNYFGITGNAAMIYGFPIPLMFDSPDILYQFPMNYEDIGNSFAEYGFGVDNYGYIGKEISRSNTVDGWGTLTTPYGTFDVLRLKCEVAEFDTIYIDSLGMGLPFYREYTEYSWLGKEQMIPLLKITSSFAGTIVTYIDSVRINPSAIYNQTDFIIDNVEVFPVPSFGIVNITFELLSRSDVEIAIYNSNGIKVTDDISFDHMPGTINFKIDLKQLGLSNGIYLLKLISDNQQITKKIILY